MAATSTVTIVTMSPEMFATREANALFSIKLMAIVLGSLVFCWLVLASYVLFQFAKSPKKFLVEEGIEMRDLGRTTARHRPDAASTWASNVPHTDFRFVPTSLQNAEFSLKIP
ncbi:hypothetical protein F4780DRAFT_780727 [Xylariomycetidae sp. FL0641]|nr:hypothetical protein F4780DRAFT_780727 [Xylariomycetidae sp. FL0641]